ncbi:MAG: lipoate--protein ligase family protein [Deltaproteobacteria bacterium]|nr:lipoate--protein ligase family protein [Deltaproteobacteria bacterium]
MQVYNLGKVPWDESQLIYHALARLGREALSLVSPASPYVCVGFHQDVEQEVDLDFCRANQIPVFRREVGGGAVYLDGDQLFFQLILHKDNPHVPKRKQTFYRKFLQPVIDVYRFMGIPAEYKPVNDLVAGSRKISGTGAGEIGDAVVFVGNLIVDFNYEMMARVLKVPDEKFRDKIHKTLYDNISSIRRELGPDAPAVWPESRLNALLAEAFQKMLGPMTPAKMDGALIHLMDDLRKRMSTAEWLYQKGRRIKARDVKIRAGVNVLHRVHKARGGLMRADVEMRDGRFGRVHLSGDFYCFPEDGVHRLEKRLENKSPASVRDVLTGFYLEAAVETPGIGIDDWMQILTPGK